MHTNGDSLKAKELGEILRKEVKQSFKMLNLGEPGQHDLKGLANGDRPAVSERLGHIAIAICGLKFSGKTVDPEWPTFWEALIKELRKANPHIPESSSPQEQPESLKEYFEIIVGLKPVPTLEPRPESVFMWRSGITDSTAFFGRRAELHSICGLVTNRQNCQIIGERRIGKTSLMLEIGRRLPTWVRKTCFTWVTMQSSRCHTLKEWLQSVTEGWGWKETTPPTTMPDFIRQVEKRLKEGQRLVLAIDECESFLSLPDEFPLQFFLDLRACGEMGLSILSFSRVSWRQLRTQSNQISPYYNTFSIVDLCQFTEKEARDYVEMDRPGLSAFTADEKKAILEWAERHPMKLQIACAEIVKAREYGKSVKEAMLAAKRQADQMLPIQGSQKRKS